jgi:hypothetical protein
MLALGRQAVRPFRAKMRMGMSVLHAEPLTLFANPGVLRFLQFGQHGLEHVLELD